MTTIVFATRNPGKVVELAQLTREIPGLLIRGLQDFDVPEVAETGATFAANATLKALAVSRATGLPALADDSGLQVDALEGAPGVYSARYAGEHADDAANNAKLARAMRGQTCKTARFRSVLALADVSGRLGGDVILAEGRCEGEILSEPQGSGGFGYDPLFYVPALKMSFAQIDLATKNQLSHRGKAMEVLLPKLIAYFAL